MLTGTIALKEDAVQFISDERGDVPAGNPESFGLYYRDTRFLSRFELTVNGVKPIFLSNAANKHYIATFQLVNPALMLPDGTRVRQQTISLRRSRFVNGRGMYERIGILNCNRHRVQLDLVLTVDADFRDIFAIRGFTTPRVAGQITVTFGGEEMSFAYRGRDGQKRTTQVTFSRPPEAISSREVRFRMDLGPNDTDTIVARIQPSVGRPALPLSPDFDTQLERLATSYKRWDESSTSISTNNELFDRELLRASRYDIRGLLEHTEYGPVPDAGVPWYAVPFGRDAIITALQTLIYNPEIAEGTLRFLAAHQGSREDPYKEEEPGKILHEMRRGELAELREVPHTPYFGTVDATPLFLVLFCEAMRWHPSDKLYEDVCPAAMRALEWIDRFGDLDGDGYVEYITHQPGGVENQGWKDSPDSIQHPDGGNAEQPIALVEVQGYVYQAKVGMARLLHNAGDYAKAARLQGEAEELKRRFNQDFWMPEEGFFALALDGHKEQVRAVASNAGHCLWSGICDPDKAELVVRRLLAPDMFSGWGIRTLSSDSLNYNPMSYHNGSVWPHDSALIALGMACSGFHQEAVTIATALLEAGLRFPDTRLPELFCGFSRDRRFNSSPSAYIVSCSPQAWAAGCVFMLLQTILGLEPDPESGAPKLEPLLSDMFRRISLDRLQVGADRFDIRVERDGAGARVTMDKTARKQSRPAPVG